MSSNLSKDVLIESLRKHIGKLEIENETSKIFNKSIRGI